MILRRPRFRVLSRALAWLFAAQFLLAGLCVLTPVAHAMPHMQAKAMATHCMDHAMKADPSSKGVPACVHCDQPDEMAQSKHVDSPLPLLMPVAVVDEIAETSLQTPRRWDRLQAIGPPKSSSLLFRTSQRIRI